MFCNNCGKELEAGDVFCGYCGVRLEPAQATQENPAVEEPVPEPIVEELAAENVTPAAEEPVQPTQESPAGTSSYEERKSPVGWVLAGVVMVIVLIATLSNGTPPSRREPPISVRVNNTLQKTEYYNQLLWTGKNKHIPQLSQKVNSTGTYKAEYTGNKLVRISWKQGNESWTWKINNAGTLEESYQEGTEFCRERKVHAATEKYDSAGNLIKRSYYGTDGGLKETSSGFAIVEFKYDGVGNEIRREYYGTNRLLKANTDGVAAIEWDYNSAGKEIANRSYDVNGKLLSKTPQKEAAKEVKSNSPSPDRTEYYNQLLWTGKKSHIPQLSQKVNSTGTYKAEYKGNKLVRISWKQGNESWTYKINDAGTIEEHYQEGTENCRKVKIHAYKLIYDGAGNRTREENYGVDGRPKDNIYGVAIYEYEYDSSGKMIAGRCYNVKGDFVGYVKLD